MLTPFSRYGRASVFFQKTPQVARFRVTRASSRILLRNALPGEFSTILVENLGKAHDNSRMN